MRCGVRPSEFGDLTPRELYMIAEEYAAVREADQRLGFIYAYRTAELLKPRGVKFAPLDKYLDSVMGKEAKPKEQTPAQQFAQVMRMHAKFEREEEKKRGSR